MNSFSFVGNLGKDPTTKFIGENQVTNFSVAVKGYKKDDTLWIDVDVWGKPAAACAEHLSKGSQVAVTGSLSTREYAAKDGTNRTVLQVRADRVTFVGAKPKANSDDHF